MSLSKDDKVKHKSKAEWGIGRIIAIENSGTAEVSFENFQSVKIAQATRFLLKIDNDGNPIKPLKKLYKGQRIICKNNPGWGIGEVLEDSYGEQIKAFFSNQRVKIFSRNNEDITELEREAARDPYLDNLSYESIETKGTVDKVPFPQLVQNFLRLFKGGLHGPVLEKHEREYKEQASEAFLALLNEKDLQQLIYSECWPEAAERIKKCHSLNLLSKFEVIKFSDALKNNHGQKEITKGLYNFLYGNDLLQKRFGDYAACLAEYECDKWPIITLPLFLRYPTKYIFIKPEMTKEAAANRDFNIQYESQLNWNTYNQVLLFYKDLYERLTIDANEDLHPRDMIDVQTFMWCTYTGGWTAEEVAKAEAELSCK
jgi:hypothetical protein